MKTFFIKALVEAMGGEWHISGDDYIVTGLDNKQDDFLREVEEALEDYEPNYEPEQDEVDIRVQNVIKDLELDVDWGEREGETLFVFPCYGDEYSKITTELQRRYGHTHDFEYGHTDEYEFCSGCRAIISITPSSYGWQPDYWLSLLDGYICADCIQTDEGIAEQYLEEHLNQTSFINPDLVDLEKRGFVALEREFESGFHRGQNADIDSLGDLLVKSEYDILFTYEPSQFYITVKAWCREEELKGVEALIDLEYRDLPYDRATQFGKALRGEHSDYIHTKTRILTADQFISGYST